MGNPVKGEVAFTVEGVEYILVFDINALCILEDRLNLPVMEIGQRFSDPSTLRLSFLREVFRAGLLTHHDEMSPEAAGALLMGVGLEGAATLIAKAFFAAFDQGKKGGARQRPQKPAETPAVGTGGPSIGDGAN